MEHLAGMPWHPGTVQMGSSLGEMGPLRHVLIWPYAYAQDWELPPVFISLYFTNGLFYVSCGSKILGKY